MTNEDEVNEHILQLIVDLGNMVIYKKTLTELQKIKQRKPVAFRSTDFFKKVMGLMEWNHYRLGVRRLVIDLFEKNVMRQIVFGDDDGEGSEAGSLGAANDGGEEPEGSSGDDRTERQKSVSEPVEMPSDLMPAPLRVRK